MYGENYGYRSGLNQSMVRHLTQKIGKLEQFAALKPGDTVLDIGSNDATSLKAYQTASLNRIGIDPTGKFRQYYPDDIKLVPDFFNAKNFDGVSKQRAKIITSIAMFYDLEDPSPSPATSKHCLAPDGIWHFEQSYMPSMLRLTSYDTICHEHVEYYSLAVVEKILDAADMKVLDVQMNAVNGGSFAVTAGHKPSPLKANRAVIDWLLAGRAHGLATPRPYREFEERVFRHREDLQRLRALRDDGKRILGYGASTRAMSFCNFAASVPISSRRSPRSIPTNSATSRRARIFRSCLGRGRAEDAAGLLILCCPGTSRMASCNASRNSRRGGKIIFPFPRNRDRLTCVPRCGATGRVCGMIISYAQNFEDVMLRASLRQRGSGLLDRCRPGIRMWIW